MTNGFKTTAIVPMGAECLATNDDTDGQTLPGTNVLGCGVDVFGEYCGATSLKKPIIDMSDRSQTDERTGKKTAHFITLQPADEGIAKEIQGSSLTEVSKQLSVSVGLKGSSGFFKGELDAAYGSSSTHTMSTRFVQYTEQLYFRKLILPSFTQLRDMMKPDVKKDFEGAMTPEELVDEYGTHFIGSAIIGARVCYSCRIESSQYDSTVDMSAAAKLSYNGLVSKGEAEASAKMKQAAKLITENSVKEARALGGESSLISKILEGSYKEWHDTIEDKMRVVDLRNGMTPISKLIENEEHRAKVQAEIDKRLVDAEVPGKPSLALVQPYLSSKPHAWYFSIEEGGQPVGFGPENYAGATFHAYSEPVNNSVPIYRLTAKNGAIYMLSSSPEKQGSWDNAEVAFYAYTKSAPDRVLVHAFRNTKAPNAHGWFYNTKPTVKGWTYDPRNNFYVPKV